MTEENVYFSKELPAEPVTPAEAVTDVIEAVAAEEKGAADVIFELSREIDAAVFFPFPPGTAVADILAALTTVDNDVRRKLKLILKKNIVLEKKLRDVVNLIPTLNLTPGSPDFALLVAALVGVINSIAKEEEALSFLITAENGKLTRVINFNEATDIDTLPGDVGDIVNFNNTAESVFKVVLDKNIVLEEKLETALRALTLLGVTAAAASAAPPCSPIPGLFATVKAALFNIIDSVGDEEFAFGGTIAIQARVIESIVSDILPDTEPEGPEFTPAQVSQVNASVENMLHTILDKNIVLETKLEDAIDFITPPVTILPFAI